MKILNCALMLVLSLSARSLAQTAPAKHPFALPESRVQEIAEDGSFALLVPRPANVKVPSDRRKELEEKKVSAGRRVFLGLDVRGGEPVWKDFSLEDRYKDSQGKPFECPLTAYRVLQRDETAGNKDLWLRVEGIKPVTIKIADPGLRKRLLGLGVDSVVRVEGTQQGCERIAEEIDVRIEDKVSKGAPFWLLAVLLVLVLGTTIFALGTSGTLGLLLGKDGLYSSSKFQLAVWFTVLIATYLATLYMRFNFAGLVGGVSIPQNLLLMSGLSALTFVGAKAVKQGQVSGAEAQRQQAVQKAEAAKTAAQSATAAAAAVPPSQALLATQQASTMQAAAMVANNAAEEAKDKLDRLNAPATRPASFWFDLVHDEAGKPSLSKFQMIIITLIAAGLYLLKASEFLSTVPVQGLISLPDVDTALLATFGLGQGAYLALKFADEGS